MKRSAPMRRTRIKPMSDKRVEENKRRATAMRWVAKRSGGRCELRAMIATVDPVAASACTGKATDGHEILTRARGGSISDPENIIHCCRGCHTYVTVHPKTAVEIGAVKSQWA